MNVRADLGTIHQQQSNHGSVVVHDWADKGMKKLAPARESDEVDCGLCLRIVFHKCFDQVDLVG